MNAITHQPQPETTDYTLPSPELNPAYAFTPSRYDGWTPERQKTFLEAISEGRTITQACRIVGLSPQSAYAFRHRPQGAAFSLAWQAACLLARDQLADELMDRVRDGYVETVSYRDGTSVERHRFDNRLGATLLRRLDRLADRASGDVSHAAARLVAAEFDAFLECLDRGPARAGVFLGARAQEATEEDLAPIRTLARADRWLRTHTSLAEEADASGLDPARRGEWSGAEWTRAEAAGLVALAPAPAAEVETRSTDQLHQPSDEDEAGPAVWWDDRAAEWRTRYPAPPGFLGEEDGDYGEDGYWRVLSPEEEQAIDGPYRAERAERARIEAAERDAFFGFAPAPNDEAPAPADDLTAAIEGAIAAAFEPDVAEDDDWEEEEDQDATSATDSPPSQGGAGGGCEQSEPATLSASGDGASPTSPPPSSSSPRTRSGAQAAAGAASEVQAAPSVRPLGFGTSPG